MSILKENTFVLLINTLSGRDRSQPLYNPMNDSRRAPPSIPANPDALITLTNYIHYNICGENMALISG